MLKALRRLGDRKRLAEKLFAGLTARSREPLFFLEFKVPDTLDGRFDLLTLHAWLVLERLAEDRDLSQALTDTIFVQFDDGLRQLGVGDIGIGHRVKKMADAFYGRLKAYGAAKDESELAAAILRNVYRGDERHTHAARELAAYVAKARAHLAASDIADADFGPLPMEIARAVSSPAEIPAPISRVYDLADLSEAGYEARIVPDAKDRAKLAEWLDVEALDAFEGVVELRRNGHNRFSYDADLEADVVQNCVVTLEPMTLHISRRFHRELHLIPNVHRFADKGGAVTLDAADDDVPEEIARSRYDLAGPLLEELVLAIDPYPRAPGVEFEAPKPEGEIESEKPESPFAVLKQLKGQG